MNIVIVRSVEASFFYIYLGLKELRHCSGMEVRFQTG
jgi:hypothetical protein